jgi:MFS family permease
MFAIAMGLFLAGSLLCGLAQSMPQLVAFRLVQGLGAGGLLPLAFIIIGHLYTYEQRARMQGLFAGVWGVSAIVGPLLGGFLVDQVSWQWVFLLNLAPGFLAGLIVWVMLPESARAARGEVRVDYAGAGLLTAGVVVLLLGLLELGTPLSYGLLALSAALLAALVWVELRAPDPILPLHLLRDRIYLVACLHGLLAGWAMFGSLTYVPLFVQAVLGTSATVAGSTLSPLMLSWVLASIVSSRLLLRLRFRLLVIAGMVILVAGTFLLSRAGLNSSYLSLATALAGMGLGMGLSIPIFLIVVQSTVPRRDLGAATSTLQFTRSIGGTIGVSVMGAALSLFLATNLQRAGIAPGSVSLNALLDPLASNGAALEGSLRAALAGAMRGVFDIGLAGAILALVSTTLLPGGELRSAAPLASQKSDLRLPTSDL